MKLLILSAAGLGNIGDDLCRESIVIELKRHNIDFESAVPPISEDVISEFDGLIVGGGGLIYDTDPINVDNYCDPIIKFKEMNKKVFIVGVGVQGIFTKYGREKYAEALSKADFVSVRSSADAKELAKIMNTENIFVAQDLAFSLKFNKSLLSYLPTVGAKPKLAMSLTHTSFSPKSREYRGDEFVDAAENFIKVTEDSMHGITEKFNTYIFIHSSSDLQWAKELQKNHNTIKIVNYLSANDQKSFIKKLDRMDFVFATRFHSAVLAMLLNKPLVGLSFKQHKLDKLYKEMALGDTWYFEDLVEDSTRLKQLKKEDFEYISPESIQAAKEKALVNLKFTDSL